MRVIAGSAGGIRLQTPKTGVRPTMDRVKAAIFSSLGEQVIGARVLDLFAGTGALGIEALSRGASAATFVDSNAEAVGAIERNLASARLTGEVRRREVFDFLRAAPGRGVYDLVFADPPYEKTAGDQTFTALLLADTNLPAMLPASGIFVLEKMPGEELPPHPAWEVLRAKTYGATEVLFLQRAP